MKNKKLWIFIGIVILILILNYIFGWSSYLGDTDNLKFLEKMVQDNLALAIGIYMAVTIVGSVVLALPGITFAILAGPWNHLLFDRGYGRGGAGVCGGQIFPERQHQTGGNEK